MILLSLFPESKAEPPSEHPPWAVTMANKHDSPTVSHGKVSAATPNPFILAHPVSHYHDLKTLLPYYLSPAGKYIREVFTKENCCNDCHQVGHGYKTCPNRCPSACSFARPVDSHEILI